MKPIINRLKVAESCRILGVHATDSLEDIKRARNRLARSFHPDKHQTLTADRQHQLQVSFDKIQTAYQYLRDHHEEITQSFLHLKNDYTLTSKGPTGNRSHWVYRSISGLTAESKSCSS